MYDLICCINAEVGRNSDIADYLKGLSFRNLVFECAQTKNVNTTFVRSLFKVQSYIQMNSIYESYYNSFKPYL